MQCFACVAKCLIGRAYTGRPGHFLLAVSALTAALGFSRAAIADDVNCPANLGAVTIDGNIQAFSNTDGLDITGNSVDGNLQCKDNVPAPTGSGNVVFGNSEDQCASLLPGDGNGGGTGGGGGSGTISGDVNCPPDLGAVTVDGNVLVSGPCRLQGTTVIGNVLLYSGGSLVAQNSRIDGNSQA